MPEENTPSIIDEVNETESIADTNESTGTNSEKATETNSAKSEGGGSSEAQKVDSATEEKSDWVLETPKDFPLPQDNLDSFAAAAKKAGLTQEQAKSMLAWHKEFHDAVMADNERIRTQTMEAWQKEMDKDADFGGAKFKATVAEARKAFAQFDGDGELRKVLRESGYDKHPAIIRVVARVGRAMGEHTFIGGNGEGSNAPLEERLWKEKA